MDQIFVVTAWVMSIVALVVSLIRYQKNKREADAKAAERDGKIQEQIARWQQGEIEAKWEPCISGHGEALVIEPESSHRIVVGRRAPGKQNVRA